MTRAEKTALFDEWLEIIDLHGWIVAINVDVPAGEFGDCGIGGDCEYQRTTRTASIRIVNEAQFYGVGEFDFEKVLVHELLHIKFAFAYPRDEGVEQDLAHQLLDDMAKVLILAKKSAKKGIEEGAQHEPCNRSETA